MLPNQSLSKFSDISTDSGKGRVPWTKLQNNQLDYIEPEYLPKDVTLRQYYHIRRQDVNAILKHWAQRQAAGKVPFAFKKVGKAKNNRSAEEGDADADLGPDGDAEGDSEHDNDSKDSEDEESQGDSSPPNGQSTSLPDAAAEDGQSDSSSAEQQPLPEKEVSNLGYLI